MKIDDMFWRAWQTPSEINEHLPLLKALASVSDTVADLGTGLGRSATAFVAGRPYRVWTIDAVDQPIAADLAQAAMQAGVNFEFVKGCTREIEIPECCLMMVDTRHTFQQLKTELKKHSSRVKKFIALHDIVLYGERGEVPGSIGILPAMRWFLESDQQWKLLHCWQNNNGLALLARKDAL